MYDENRNMLLPARTIEIEREERIFLNRGYFASARDRQCVCVLRDFGDFLERESGYKCMYDGRGNRCREKRARLLHGNGVVFSFMKSLC